MKDLLEEMHHLMIIQNNVVVLHIDLSMQKAWKGVEELREVYHDISSYLLRRNAGEEKPFDVFGHIEKRLIHICGKDATDELYRHVRTDLGGDAAGGTRKTLR